MLLTHTGHTVVCLNKVNATVCHVSQYKDMLQIYWVASGEWYLEGTPNRTSLVYLSLLYCQLVVDAGIKKQDLSAAVTLLYFTLL